VVGCVCKDTGVASHEGLFFVSEQIARRGCKGKRGREIVKGVSDLGEVQGALSSVRVHFGLIGMQTYTQKIE